MEIVKIEAQSRSEKGKNAAKSLRGQGLIPCNLYGGKENINFAVADADIRPLIYTPAFKVAELTIGGNTVKAIVKEIQAHPLTDNIIHIDFQELVDDVKVKVAVPLKLIGSPKAVAMGGKLEQTMRKLNILALPKDLPSEIVFDVSDMDFGHIRRIKDLPAEGITYLHQPNIPIARLAVTRAVKEAEAAAAKDAKGKK